MVLAVVALAVALAVAVALALRWRARGTELDHQLIRLQREHEASEVARAGAALAVQRLATSLDGLQHGVVVCDEEGRELYRNELSYAFAGAHHGDALAEQAISDALRAAVSGALQDQTIDLYGPPRRSLRITAGPLTGDDGRSLGAIAVIEDISDRKRLEAVRRDFVANVSHELKTPVGALALLAETLVDEDDTNVTRRLAERMHLEAVRVGRIIDDLLDLGRIEAEESPRRESVPVQVVVAEAVARLRQAADLREITIDATAPPGRLAVYGDRLQLVSALANLLDNAVKYSDPGGTVTVSCRSDGPTIELSVRDRGVGIPSRDHERIFERFYRVDPARGRDTGGTGLGLAIVRHVATNHHGWVTLESIEGEGSTFTFHLPAGPGSIGLVEEESA